MELKIIEIKKSEDVNIVIGQAHFIKTVEDIYEILISSSTSLQFGLAFSEASGKCLIRADGNNQELKKIAIDNALAIASGHIFIIVVREGFPINFLNSIKMVPEVCRIFVATANPLQVIVAQTTQGRGILGVVDGNSPSGVEDTIEEQKRKDFLRNIGYKR